MTELGNVEKQLSHFVVGLNLISPIDVKYRSEMPIKDMVVKELQFEHDMFGEKVPSPSGQNKLKGFEKEAMTETEQLLQEIVGVNVNESVALILVKYGNEAIIELDGNFEAQLVHVIVGLNNVEYEFVV